MTPSHVAECVSTQPKRWSGARAGQAMGHEMGNPRCRRRKNGRKATLMVALARAAGGPRGVEDPEHARNLHAREPGDPALALSPGSWIGGRSGRAKAGSPR